MKKIVLIFILNFTHDDTPIKLVKIYDISGELVLEDKNSGSTEVTWNGKNESGKYVASGVYFMIVMNEAKKKAVIKIAVLR